MNIPINNLTLAEGAEGDERASRVFIARRFILTVAASWLVAPLGVLALHLTGLGDSAHLITVLLAMSVSIPFQLLLNEFLAVAAADGRIEVGVSRLSIVAVLHLIAIFASLLNTAGTQWALPMPQILGVSILTTANLIMSYYSVRYYYHLVVFGKISHRQSFINGCLTGIFTLFIYVLAIILNNDAIIVGALIIPGAAHLLYFRYLHAVSGLSLKSASGTPNPSYILILLGSLAFIGSTFAGSWLRVLLISAFPDISAILLIIVNMIGTAAFTISRTRFLAAEHRPGVSQTFIWALAAGLSALVLLLFPGKFHLIAAMVGLHLINVVVVERLRESGRWSRKTPASASRL